MTMTVIATVNQVLQTTSRLLPLSSIAKALDKVPNQRLSLLRALQVRMLQQMSISISRVLRQLMPTQALVDYLLQAHRSHLQPMTRRWGRVVVERINSLQSSGAFFPLAKILPPLPAL